MFKSIGVRRWQRFHLRLIVIQEPGYRLICLFLFISGGELLLILNYALQFSEVNFRLQLCVHDFNIRRGFCDALLLLLDHRQFLRLFLLLDRRLLRALYVHR